ncbi:hypothetical protein GCM10022254_73030 [Actinomadura meridiana]|uniref:DUF6777 domain-containing protein n=1 Tax=Actinomadura meridiana TaxID=559626 RepID=A0ABP8CPV4_9ACTN
MPDIHSLFRRRGVSPGPGGASAWGGFVVAAALALVAGALTGCGNTAANITRLTVGTPGPDPYARAADTDQLKIKERPVVGGTQDGDAPGLYGGTRQASTCDQRKLIAFLRANPDKARAWADVHGIAVSDIERFVSQLTPVLLRFDTLVTNHGFRDGKATSGPAVLQAGMGVLINGYGVPVVKCNCGNPLTRPEEGLSVRASSYSGRSWPGFAKGKVTEVLPRDSRKGPIVTFVLVDPEATMGFERPRASEGESDGPPTELPPTETEGLTSDSPSPSDSGLDSPGPESPGTEPPSTETPDPGVSPASPGMPSDGPSTGDPVTGGDGGTPTRGVAPEGPVSPRPAREPMAAFA